MHHAAHMQCTCGAHAVHNAPSLHRCNVHGNLHTGCAISPTSATAALSGGSGEWFVVEPGWPHLGCPAVDLGIFLAHLLLAAVHCGLQASPDESGPSHVPSWPPAKPSTKSAVHAMLDSAWSTYMLETRRGVNSGPPLTEEVD